MPPRKAGGGHRGRQRGDGDEDAGGEEEDEAEGSDGDRGGKNADHERGADGDEENEITEASDDGDEAAERAERGNTDAPIHDSDESESTERGEAKANSVGGRGGDGGDYGDGDTTAPYPPTTKLRQPKNGHESAGRSRHGSRGGNASSGQNTSAQSRRERKRGRESCVDEFLSLGAMRPLSAICTTAEAAPIRTAARRHLSPPTRIPTTRERRPYSRRA